MILYHASTEIIEHPDIFHSRESLDFGKGFYLTVLKEQAIKYAERFLRRGKRAYINAYELETDLSGFRTKEFEGYDEEWLLFVAKCRKGLAHENYDWISGGIADDRVFNTLDLYFSEEITKDEALRKLIYEKPNSQICISNQDILSKYLRFIEFIEL